MELTTQTDPQASTKGTPRMTIRTQVVTVTPELAELWLAVTNIHNRNPRPARIEAYARDMAAGRWAMTGEAIKFGGPDQSVLLDGQNRLAAIIKAGTPVEMLIMSGIDIEAQALMDSGMARTASDALKLEGTTTHTALSSAVARSCISWMAGDVKHSRDVFGSVTTAEIMEFVGSDLNFDEAMRAARTFGRSGKARRAMMRQAAAGFFYWIAVTAGAPPEDVWSYLTDLVEGRSDGAGDPRAAVTQRLASAAATRETMTGITETYLLTRGWNAMRAGETIHKLIIARDGKPVSFPVPAQ